LEKGFVMALVTKNRLKYVLAGMGAVYAILFVGYLIYAGVTQTAPQGPSELEAHPEKQDEILARQRVDEFKSQLSLTDEQAQRITDILAANGGGFLEGGPPDGNFRGRWQGVRDQIAQVLTPEQQAQAQQMMGQFGGRGGGGPGGRGGGGPMGRMTPERVESLKQKMTPEQQERFQKKIEQMQQRRQQGQGGRGQRGGPQQPQR
jgi:Spy/CpxP family protein refolding chaperone